jgi:DnaK suppressor protein
MSDHPTAARRAGPAAGRERELKGLLEAEKRRLLRRYAADVERERGIGFDEAEDFADRADKSWDREELFAMTEAEREQLRLVEEALARLAEGGYGLCFADDRPIPVSRLRAVPWARYCAKHQSDLEAGRIQERRPAG